MLSRKQGRIQKGNRDGHTHMHTNTQLTVNWEFSITIPSKTAAVLLQLSLNCLMILLIFSNRCTSWCSLAVARVIIRNLEYERPPVQAFCKRAFWLGSAQLVLEAHTSKAKKSLTLHARTELLHLRHKCHRRNLRGFEATPEQKQ